MIDENDPVVRAVQAPFDVSMGEYRRSVTEAGAQFQQDITAIKEQIKEREAKAKEQQEAGLPAEYRELLTTPASQQREQRKNPEWDYDNPLPEDRPAPSWASETAPQAAAVPTEPIPEYGTPRQQAPAPEPSWDYSDPLSAGAPTPSRPSWPAPVGKAPETEELPVAQPPAPPRRARQARPAEPQDDDYSGESWLR